MSFLSEFSKQQAHLSVIIHLTQEVEHTVLHGARVGVLYLDLGGPAREPYGGKSEEFAGGHMP
jgi:hypothetical protein